LPQETPNKIHPLISLLIGKLQGENFESTLTLKESGQRTLKTDFA
jgi:hypothetical protein